METQRDWISKGGIEEFWEIALSKPPSALQYLSWNALIASILQKKLHNL